MVARSLLDFLEISCAKYANADAFVYGETRLTYDYFANVVSRLASGLARLGLQPGERVGLMMPNLPQFPLAYYALLTLGAQVVPLNLLAREAEIEAVLHETQAAGFIAWEGFGRYIIPAAKRVPACRIAVLLGNLTPELREALHPNVCAEMTKLVSESQPLSKRPALDPEEPALILYTSGATDAPRGVVLSHENAAAAVLSCWEAFNITSQHRFAAALPLFHSLGHMLTMNVSLAAGACCVLAPRLNVNEIVATIARERITHFVAVPSMLPMLLEGQNATSAEAAPGEDPLRSLQVFLVSGARMEDHLREALLQRFGKPIYEGYGLAECPPLITTNRPDIAIKAGSVGKQLPGLEVTIFDANGFEVPPGQAGEIVVRGGAVMKGYYNRPEETQKTLREGWLLTGDMGWMDAAGYLHLVDRKKDVIKKGGFFVFSQEVERCLISHPKIRECAVVGVNDRALVEEVKAYIVLRQQEAATKEEIVSYCASHLAAYKIPQHVEFCADLPHGPTGKILKRMLRERAAQA
jgi:long-chain acyl-CoA synthetase